MRDTGWEVVAYYKEMAQCRSRFLNFLGHPHAAEVALALDRGVSDGFGEFYEVANLMFAMPRKRQNGDSADAKSAK